MDCTEFLHRYSDYDDSLLTAGELTSFRRHLAECGSCARYDRVLRKGRMLARQLPPPEPGEDFIPRLQSRLWRSRWERPARPALPVLGGAAGALAAVTVTLVAVWSLSLMEAGADPATRSARAPAGFPADAVAGGGGGSFEPAGTILAERPAWSSASWGAVPGGGWASERVDPDAGSSYSPLVTGPPVYRSGSAARVTAAGAGEPALD